MATPSFGPYPDDMTVQIWLDSTVAKLFADDHEELAKIPTLVASFRKHVKVLDVAGLQELPLSGWKVALSRALPYPEVSGMLKIMLKHLGAPGTPHVPPGMPIRASARPAFLVRLIFCVQSGPRRRGGRGRGGSARRRYGRCGRDGGAPPMGQGGRRWLLELAGLQGGDPLVAGHLARADQVA